MIKFATPCDLTTTSLWDAICKMVDQGANPAFVVCALSNVRWANAAVAGLPKKVADFWVIAVPDAMLSSKDSWAVVPNDGGINGCWSEGV